MDESTYKNVKTLIEAGKIDEAVTILSRRFPVDELSLGLMGMITDARSLPNNIITALRRGDFKILGARDLMELRFFLQNTLHQNKKEGFLSQEASLNITNILKRVERAIEGDYE